jgi:hypothetical protein
MFRWVAFFKYAVARASGEICEDGPSPGPITVPDCTTFAPGSFSPS